MKKKIILGFITLLIPVFSLAPGFLQAENVSAKSCSGVDTSIIECEDEESGIGHILKLAINILSVGIAILAVIGITVTGIQYLTAKNNEEQVRKAKKRLVEIVIGIIIYVLIAGLLQWLIPGSTDPDDIAYYEPPESYSSGYTYPGIDDSGGGSGGSGGSGGFTETKQCTAKTDKEFINDSNGGIPGYYINIPSGANQKTPIIFYLSGSGETNGFNGQGLETAKARLLRIASIQFLFSTKDYISVIPIGPSSGWPVNAVVGLARGSWGKINDYLKNCGGIGSRKKYIMGMSLGAQGVWTIINSNPTLFDGAAPVSGYTSGAQAGNIGSTKIVAAVGTTGTGYENTSRASMGQLIGNLKTTGRLVVYLGATHDTITASINYEKLFGCLIKDSCGGSFDGKLPAIVYNSSSSGSWSSWCSENLVKKYGGSCSY